jgi:acetyl-CoA carboxylase biotin carboxyl carrier protein
VSILNFNRSYELDLSDIKEIIELMKANDLAVFELEKEGEKLKLERPLAAPQALMPMSVAAPAFPVAPPPEAAAAPAAATPSGPEITSPMVGTYYASPSPESPVFVTPGQEVTPETVVCIIEAMKVMNEIKAEVSGVISEIVAENGKPVQFGQTLFRLK